MFLAQHKTVLKCNKHNKKVKTMGKNGEGKEIKTINPAIGQLLSVVCGIGDALLDAF